MVGTNRKRYMLGAALTFAALLLLAHGLMGHRGHAEAKTPTTDSDAHYQPIDMETLGRSPGSQSREGHVKLAAPSRPESTQPRTNLRETHDIGAPTGADGGVNIEEPSQTPPRSEAARARDERFEQLAAQFEHEARDAPWAQQREQELSHTLEEALTSFAVEGLECRSETCRLELGRFGDTISDVVELSTFVRHLGPSHVLRGIDPHEGEDEESRGHFVLYLPRDGNRG